MDYSEICVIWSTLMLEAVHTDLVFTISLKRSTQNLQLSTSSPADYPIYAPKAEVISEHWILSSAFRLGRGVAIVLRHEYPKR